MKMQMTQVDLHASVGKTIAGVAGNFDRRMIVFTDKTFVHLGVDRGYDGDASVEDEKYDWADSDVPHEELIALGVFTKEELDLERTSRHMQWMKKSEEDDRALYERLKSKFENK